MTHLDAPSLSARREGFLLGAPVGAVLAAGPPPPGARHAAIALGDGLIEELLSGGVDLRRLAARWVRWRHDDGHGLDASLTESLAHLEEFDAPPVTLAATGAWALAAALPAALAAASPRSMVSGAFHTARLLDPDPESGLAAVTLVLAAARFLEGSRDFLPDVLSLLRSNNASDVLIDRFVDIARDPRATPPPPRGAHVPALEVTLWALRIAQHKPRSHEALASMQSAGGIGATAGAVLGALLGARDGVTAWPEQWLAASGEEVRLRISLARRLSQAGAGT